MKKTLKGIKTGDIITRESGARYNVLTTLYIEGRLYVVYQHIKGMRPKINPISHLKSWNYWIETRGKDVAPVEKPHEHNWQFVKKYIGAGKPVLKRRLVHNTISGLEGPSDSEPIMVQMWMDARHEYAQFICECGKEKSELVKNGKA